MSDDHHTDALALAALDLVTALIDELNLTNPGLAVRVTDRAYNSRAAGRGQTETLEILAKYRQGARGAG
jgi:hypothetical protein